jgi:hypothetical protein
MLLLATRVWLRAQRRSAARRLARRILWRRVARALAAVLTPPPVV